MRFVQGHIASGTNLQDLVETISIRSREYIVAPLSDLEFGEQGQLRHAGLEYGLTRLAAHRLGGKVGIPGSFIDKGPSDIIAWNFNQFLPNARGTVQLALEGSTVVGILPERARPVPLDILVECVTDVEPRLDLARWDLVDQGLRMRFTSPALLVEPRVGDIVRAGVDVWDYENDGGSLGVSGALFRLVCSNGAVVPEVNFNGEIRREGWREPHAVVMAAVGYFQEAVQQANLFGQGLTDLTNHRFELPTDGDERSRVLRPAIRVVGIPGRFSESVANALVTEEQTAYGFYNAVTRLGRDAVAIEDRRRFERAGYLTVTRSEQLVTALEDALEAEF
jgi:hypothetical protein